MGVCDGIFMTGYFDGLILLITKSVMSSVDR